MSDPQDLGRRAMAALKRALSEGHHADKCPVRYGDPCVCWRSEAVDVVAALEAADE